MKVTFLGGAEIVTGSCFLVETGKKKFLVDCGLFQGKEEDLNEEPFDFNVNSIDFVILTHAHIDHSGRVPRLVKEGFKGPVYATKATADLCAIMLPDSGHIQEMETEWQNRKRTRAGKELVEPLYTAEDARQSLQYFKHTFYGDIIGVDDCISMRFNDAGHILGSSMVEIWIKEGGENIKLVFSGDIGQNNQPILRDPSIIKEADYLFIESTYGNRLHESFNDRVGKLHEIIDKTVKRGGNVIIPSFAVGRTQELLYHLNSLKEDKDNEYLRGVKVFIDSPLAISATRIFVDNPQCYDEETVKLLKTGDNPFEFDDLYFTRTAEESMKINEIKGGAVIISASGMCNAGRIKHHLKYNLWRPEASVVFVGYQAVGTLGRAIKDGAQRVKILGDEIGISAEIYNIDGFSGHADRDGLLDWLSGFTKKPRKIFVVHGEKDSAEDFAKLAAERLGLETVVPGMGETIEIGLKKVVSTGRKDLHKAVTGMKVPDISELTVRVMQVKVKFMEAMDSIYKSVVSGQLEPGEAGRIIEELHRILDEERAG
ncbi:MAG: MBL fold metallo-hydrolase [Bacillota bacterium]|jgi:metallo-beta-lactamase family protein|nr:MBL fold metallo-hydrolase [Bacillota bacterium]MDD3850887.1 MBL fold metallo-hydrolase [Bacillota bacterium]MDD4707843.1 MBL fold metallo-hydrolase [Bacillota bacterium]